MLNTNTKKSQSFQNPVKAKHAIMHLNTVKELVEEIKLKIENLKKNKQNYKTVINDLNNKGSNEYEKVLENLENVFKQIFSNFKNQIIQQKLENEKLQQRVVELKKEKTDIQNLIINCAKKCTELEKDLGQYPIE